MKFSYLMIFLLSWIVQAQSAIDTVSQISENQIIDTVFSKDSTVQLHDNDTIANFDKLWLNELIQHSQHSINLNTPFDKDSTTYNALSTSELKEHLTELNKKSFFHIEYNPILEQTINRYLQNRRQTLEKLMRLSSYYFPMIEEVLISEQIPLELKYLPIIESAFNPKAKSPAGATGLWQFMYTTGKRFDLELNNYVDERFDPIQSTKAAAKYLKKLYEIFRDWELVLAAYNSGPGNVTKAMRRAKNKTNYWNIRPYLPKETANYVPAFMATMYIFEYAKHYGFNVSYPEQPFFATDTIQVKRTIPFEDISEITGLSVDEISFFNPEYYLNIVPYSAEKNYALRLPVSKIGTFVSHEDLIYAQLEEKEQQREKPFAKLVEISPDMLKGKHIYTVKKGDVLGKIASKYKVSVKKIKQWNHLINNNIRIGQKLIIYK